MCSSDCTLAWARTGTCLRLQLAGFDVFFTRTQLCTVLSKHTSAVCYLWEMRKQHSDLLRMLQ
jgi:hypothetical protein